MNLERYIDRLEQYETGAMTSAERAGFERELAENAELRQALALYRQANDVVELQVENTLRTQLQHWAVADTPTGTSRGRVVSLRTTWVRWAAAAAAALLLGWYGLHWAGNRFSDPALYASFYEKPTDSGFRAGSSGAHPLQTGFDALQAADFPRAIAFFSNIPADNERYAEAQYYLGHAALQSGQFDTAIAAFQAAAGRDEPKFREKAEWNLLLAYLAAGRDEDPTFRTLLNRVAETPAHSFSDQAKELRSKLSSVWRNWVR